MEGGREGGMDEGRDGGMEVLNCKEKQNNPGVIGLRSADFI